jgi:tellurite resistance protein TehA-like permease
VVLDYGIPLALITTLKRGPSLDQVNGTWFLWSVGSESVAVAVASLARVTPGHAVAVLAVVCWAVGLMQYLLTAALVLARPLARPVQPEGLTPSVWIFMGAAAIAVLAGVRLIALHPGTTIPVGMYAVTTHELGRATATSWMTSVGRWEVCIAVVFWAVVFAAMVAARLRARPTTAHGSAGAGQTARPQSTASTATGALP